MGSSERVEGGRVLGKQVLRRRGFGRRTADYIEEEVNH